MQRRICGNVFLADTDKMKAAEPHTEGILTMIEKTLGISGIFATDLTQLSDFGITKRELAGLSGRVGFPLQRSDYVWKIAEKMAKRKSD